GRPRPTAGRSARACRPARHTPCAVRSVALAAGPGPARRAGRPPRTRSGARSRRRHRTRPPSARRSRCGAGTPAPAAPDGQEATAATETRALLDACGPDRPRTRGPRGTDPAQHDRTASELLVVKVVANLDLPGALSITDAPRGPRAACDQQRSRWNQLPVLLRRRRGRRAPRLRAGGAPRRPAGNGDDRADGPPRRRGLDRDEVRPCRPPRAACADRRPGRGDGVAVRDRAARRRARLPDGRGDLPARRAADPKQPRDRAVRRSLSVGALVAGAAAGALLIRESLRTAPLWAGAALLLLIVALSLVSARASGGERRARARTAGERTAG